MKLIRIAAENFKGQTFSEPLAAAQLFVGSNFSGKTARTDAIRLLLMGYLPELGKTNKDTFALSSGRMMQVQGFFEDGSTMWRRWTLKGDSVRAEEEIPETFKDSARFEVMLDAAKYFSLSDRARVEYVFSLVNLGQMWTANGIESRLIEKATDKDRAQALFVEIPQTKTLQELVDAAITTATDAQKLAKQNAVRFEQTIQGLSALRAEDEPGPIISRMEGQARDLQTAILETSTRRGELMGGYTAIRSARVRRAEIDREKSFGDKSRQELTALKLRVDLIQKKRSEVFPPTKTVEGDLLLNIATLSSRMTNGLRENSLMRENWQRVEKKMREVDGQTVCPYCGATGEDWKKIKLAEYAKEVEGFEEVIAANLKANVQTQTDLDLAKESQRAFQAYNEQLTALDADEAACLRSIARLEPQIARLSTLDEERARLVPEDPDMEANVETLQADLNVKSEQLRAIQGQIKACMGRQSELQRLAQAEKERDEAKLDETAAKEMAAELRVIQAEMVASAFAPLLARANQFFPRVLKAPIEYNAKTGEIGMSYDGLFIAHHTFSGTEKALTYAAMQAALTAGNPCRIMIIDELGRLDNLNLGKLLDGVLQAIISGYVDNFVGIDAGRMEYYAACVAGVEGADSAFNARLIK